jgi:hypothetical protein
MAGTVILSIQQFPFFGKCHAGTNDSLVFTAKKKWKSWIIYQFPPFPISYLELAPLVLADSCRNPRFLDSEQFAMGFPDGIHKHLFVTDQLLDRRCIIVKSYQTTRNPGFERKSQNVVQAFTYPASYSLAGNP